jgi:hypothetical protein
MGNGDTSAAALASVSPTSILHRTPWRPPTAVSAEGQYVTLEDGQRLLDGCGGASVTAVGHGHPDVVKAVQEQAAKMTCMFSLILSIKVIQVMMRLPLDVYNMQLSNTQAEELARVLVASGKGAFEMCVFVSGGKRFFRVLIARRSRPSQDPRPWRQFSSSEDRYYHDIAAVVDFLIGFDLLVFLGKQAK